jgi:hypothetical protein
MSGPVPKPPELRQRRNRVSTAATLTTETGRRRTPKLPGDRDWHAMTRAWWRDVWRSPMAAEYLQADTHGLMRLAVLVEAYWREPTTALAAEIRLQGQCFGLTPIDRRRLQWEVSRVETAERRQAPSRTPPPPETDPRRLLSVV